jgi:hypothetical protein
VPIITVKFQDKDPAGFIAEKQALRADLDDLGKSAAEIYAVLAGALGLKDRMQGALLAAFISSDDFGQTKACFDLVGRTITRLSEAELKVIQDGFSSNPYLHNAWYLTNHDRLAKFLSQCTGKRVIRDGQTLKIQTDEDDEIPF